MRCAQHYPLKIAPGDQQIRPELSRVKSLYRAIILLLNELPARLSIKIAQAGGGGIPVSGLKSIRLHPWWYWEGRSNAWRGFKGEISFVDAVLPCRWSY